MYGARLDAVINSAPTNPITTTTLLSILFYPFTESRVKLLSRGSTQRGSFGNSTRYPCKALHYTIIIY